MLGFVRFYMVFPMLFYSVNKSSINSAKTPFLGAKKNQNLFVPVLFFAFRRWGFFWYGRDTITVLFFCCAGNEFLNNYVRAYCVFNFLSGYDDNRIQPVRFLQYPMVYIYCTSHETVSTPKKGVTVPQVKP